MWPEIETSCVPGHFGRPTFLNASAPCMTMPATLDSVSTLLTTVGRWKRPLTVSRGGRLRGYPRLPSTEESSPEASPQTYEPAPRMITMSQAKSSLPRMRSPK